MNRRPGMRLAAPFVAMGALATGCATPEPSSTMLRSGATVTPVLTEHTPGLRCLGQLIEQSTARPVAVVIRDIDDTTVPLFNEERRLSLGGSFVLQTAISRMETSRVQGVIDADLAGPRALTFTGAWTQDDQFARERGLSLRLRAGNYLGRLGGRDSYDLIAGDFVTSVGGRVQLSTAVGVALSRNGRSALLLVDDGRNGAEVGLDGEIVQGPQMAQRRILEAVALVHVADHFKIDYRPCLEASFASPEQFVSSLSTYEDSSRSNQNRLVQEQLLRLNLLATDPDGIWGPASRSALATFQLQRKIPPTGEPSAVVFALLRSMEGGPSQ